MFNRSTLLLIALCNVGLAHADIIDDTIQVEMKKRQIPGLSLAIIDGGKIVKLEGYGVTEKGGKVAVTAKTLFQAGSVSKPVAALGALYLVEQGKLTLDEDVNVKLVTWKVPENVFTADKKVTLRGLLSHSAGLTVHGFSGYDVDGKIPTVVQVLNGEAPANTKAVRVDIFPGSTRYSGGGYTVLQQLMADVSGTPFPQYMRDAVLSPFGMRDSSYVQPPTAIRAQMSATGHSTDRSVVQGRWHLYPEMAAAGLWTNPADLARFAIAIQQSLSSKSNPVISAKLTREMLTNQKDGFGLGLELRGQGQELQFSHGGRNEGFDTLLQAFAETGQGAVVMINANDNSRMMSRIMSAIANEYHWPGAKLVAGIVASDAKPDNALLNRLAGRYELSNNNMLTLVCEQGILTSISDGFPDEQFAPVGSLTFQSISSNQTLTFQADEKGMVTGLVLANAGRERKAPRIAPLPQSLNIKVDPNPVRTKLVKAAIEAVSNGAVAVAESKFIAAPRKVHPGLGIQELASIRSFTYLAEEDVGGRAIERHGSKVDKVLLYKADNSGGKAYLMIFLDGEGLLADYDLVDI